MARIQAGATGIHAAPYALTDPNGTGTFPVQVYLPEGVTATYRIVGRVSPEAPWVEIRAESSSGMLEAMSYLPYIAVDISAISGGSLVAWVGEQ